jgi:hypothetical protein
LDQLTKDFFSNKFTGITNPIYLDDDILCTNVPVVDVPLKIDTEFLLNLISIPKNTVVREKYPYETDLRIYNWDMDVLWSDSTVSTHLSDVYYKKPSQPINFKLAVDNAEIIQEYLSKIGITTKLCMISNFKPGGYVRPHRDIGTNKRPLSYFWLPLNAPTNSELKIYPYGTVDVTVGNLYLLNQENYVHSVKNDSNVDRLVLLGYIDTLSNNILELVKTSILNTYRLTT